MTDSPRTPAQRLQDDIALWQLRDENERLRKQQADRVSNGNGNGNSLLLKVLAGILSTLAISGVVGSIVMYREMGQVASRLEAVERQSEQNRARLDWLIQQFYYDRRQRER